MISINLQSISVIGVMIFSIVTPLWGLWDAIFKRQPYISEVRKGVEF